MMKYLRELQTNIVNIVKHNEMFYKYKSEYFWVEM